MTTVKVTLSDACTDVLVWLTEQPRKKWWTWHGITAAVVPPGTFGGRTTVSNALRTLREMGLVEAKFADASLLGWRATDSGRDAVADAQRETP